MSILILEKFPYKAAALYSSRLWRHLTDYQVLIQIIHHPTRKQEDFDGLYDFVSDLESTPGVKALLVPNKGIFCPWNAQISRFALYYNSIVLSLDIVYIYVHRLLAHKAHFILDEDVVITSDVDAFPMTRKIFGNTLNMKKKVWIFDYNKAVRKGFNFPMTFVAMKKKNWAKYFPHDSTFQLGG